MKTQSKTQSRTPKALRNDEELVRAIMEARTKIGGGVPRPCINYCSYCSQG